MSFEVKSSTSSPRQATYISQYSHELVSAYLVESTKGDLLCVRRFFEGETSSKFMVCKLVLEDDNGFVVGEVEVQSIGDDALFLGDNSPSVSVLASNYPGCQPNCIYFTLRF